MGVIGQAEDGTTRALLSVFGPAQIGDPLAPDRDIPAEDRERDQALQDGFVRVVGADGRSYLVPRG
ncbi:hypothetical protein [Cellulomonas denverensis]|uniref:Uncharacterized protein n=1 Tax=Cellulomonas denverensis TaxID=264297 RepID=A0A7X6KXK4_9CELL|nr:hypothetical protein [Cellulomonas denverensis]NKY24036.1 hypothetical protein [Cellulomonas denverensis]GIG26553.1 hypothetical protein Cde04nite_27970 [Cellulomonas denverensis]